LAPPWREESADGRELQAGACPERGLSQENRKTEKQEKHKGFQPKNRKRQEPDGRELQPRICPEADFHRKTEKTGKQENHKGFQPEIRKRQEPDRKRQGLWLLP
jgi:hypothetical protein